MRSAFTISHFPEISHLNSFFGGSNVIFVIRNFTVFPPPPLNNGNKNQIGTHFNTRGKITNKITKMHIEHHQVAKHYIAKMYSQGHICLYKNTVALSHLKLQRQQKQHGLR